MLIKYLFFKLFTIVCIITTFDNFGQFCIISIWDTTVYSSNRYMYFSSPSKLRVFAIKIYIVTIIFIFDYT